MFPVRLQASAPVARRGSIVPRTICRAEKPDSSGSDSVVNEDVLSKLRKFEEENAKLRAQLSEQDPESAEPAPAQKARIDGGSMRREGLFSDKSQSQNWISESDVDFFTGGGPGEADAKVSAEETATVTKRVILGIVGSAIIGGLALIPTESLDGAATKPLYFYLIPVLRSIDLLNDLDTEIAEGDLEKVPLVIDRVLNRPNDARKNMYTAVEFIQPNGTGNAKQTARETVSAFVDYVQQADYNKYYDNLSNKRIDGKQAAQFQEFSQNSIRAAVKTANKFLALFPAEDVRLARAQMLPPP